MEAENALFANGQNANEKGLQKSKKKKQQKEWIRKEVNYWLDYDSPYAEYLVARFREWSPQIRVITNTYLIKYIGSLIERRYEFQTRLSQV